MTEPVFVAFATQKGGAGKSTLIKVLTGVHEFESGSIHMNGENKDIINHSPQEAQANGISTVYQEVNLCPNLTVAENLFIGREPRKMGMIDWKQMNERSGKLLESLMCRQHRCWKNVPSLSSR
mgnify:CR=1 FL=1